MRITEAARRLGTSPRMLRYRESLGLLPAVREAPGRWTRSSAGPGSGHRRFGPDDLEAVAAALAVEQRYEIGPAALAFGIRVLTETPARAAVADVARRLGRLQPQPARALDFEQERALRLLSGR